MTAPLTNLYPYTQQTLKNLIASIDGPLKPNVPQTFLPGSTVQITLRTTDGTNISSSYSSVKAEFKGTSGVQSDGALPSMHPLFQQNLTFDITNASSSVTTSTKVPKFSSCDCRAHSMVPLPQTLSVINKEGRSANRDFQEGGFVVAYTIEVVARKKGLGKPVRFTLPVVIANAEPFGPSVFTSPSLEDAEAAWAALGEWVWRTSTLVDLRPQLGPAFPQVTQAQIGYHCTILPTRVFFRWRITLTPAETCDLPILLKYLEPGNVEVFLARRIIPLLSDRQGGGVGTGKAYRTDLSDMPAKKGEPHLVATDEGPVARQEGSFELPPKTIALVKSCNAELQHILIASITNPMFSHPLNVHTQLHRPFGEAAPLSKPTGRNLTLKPSSTRSSDPPVYNVRLTSAQS